MNPIDAAYERLVDAGKVGITGERWSQSRGDRFRYGGRECQRGGCHRTARRVTQLTFRLFVILCDPCADAIEGRAAPFA